MDERICEEIKMDDPVCEEIRRKLTKAGWFSLLGLFLGGVAFYTLLSYLLSLEETSMLMTVVSGMTFVGMSTLFTELYKKHLCKKYPDYQEFIKKDAYTIIPLDKQNEMYDRSAKILGIIFPLGMFSVILFVIIIMITRSVPIAMTALFAVILLTVFFTGVFRKTAK
jgi:hypothetical protein